MDREGGGVNPSTEQRLRDALEQIVRATQRPTAGPEHELLSINVIARRALAGPITLDSLKEPA